MKPSKFINKNEKKVFHIVIDDRVYLRRSDIIYSMDLIKKKLDKRFIDKKILKNKIKKMFRSKKYPLTTIKEAFIIDDLEEEILKLLEE